MQTKEEKAHSEMRALAGHLPLPYGLTSKPAMPTRPLLAPVPAVQGGLLGYRRRSDADMPFYWHFHRWFELTLMIDSRGDRFVGDDISAYGPGDLVLAGPALPHTWSGDPSFKGLHECAVIHFAADLVPDTQIQGLGLDRLVELLQASERGLAFSERTANAVLPLVEAMNGARPLRQVARLLEILDILSADKSARPLSSSILGDHVSTADITTADRVCRYIGQNLTRELFVDEVASFAAMSVSTFSRFIKRATGKTFVEYVNELRIRYACRLLRDTDRGVSAVAYLSGFHNVANFNRHFRRSEGMTPREYRLKISQT